MNLGTGALRRQTSGILISSDFVLPYYNCSRINFVQLWVSILMLSSARNITFPPQKLSRILFCNQ
jgi:hypothetical protein